MIFLSADRVVNSILTDFRSTEVRKTKLICIEERNCCLCLSEDKAARRKSGKVEGEERAEQWQH